MTSKHIIEQNTALQEKLVALQEENTILKGEISDLDENMERTEKGVVYLRGLLSNLGEQNKLYKKYMQKFEIIYHYEQYAHFLVIALLYLISIYVKSYYILMTVLACTVTSKFVVAKFDSKNDYAKYIKDIKIIEDTIDPLHDLISNM
jgi:dynactin complex subunit